MNHLKLDWGRNWRTYYMDRDTATSKGDFQSMSHRDSCAPLGKCRSQSSGCSTAEQGQSPVCPGDLATQPLRLRHQANPESEHLQDMLQTCHPWELSPLGDRHNISSPFHLESPTNRIKRRKDKKSKHIANPTCL